MRFAYADPPYLGCGKLYPEHPEALRWDDPSAHGDLMAELERDFDGWAMSASAPSLQLLLPLAPENVRVAAWVKPFAAFKRNVRIAYTWEPVLFRPGRDSSSCYRRRESLSLPRNLSKGVMPLAERPSRALRGEPTKETRCESEQS